jgi:endonuclease/exonuclease/phosphatase family metal-dependent hydrolase
VPAVRITVGTFNLNNLFGRWNFYAEVPSDDARAVAPAAPRSWLQPAEPVEPIPAGRRDLAAGDAAARSLPDVQLVLDGTVTEAGIQWRTNRFTGRPVFRKDPEAQRTLARRIRAMEVDVLALQEVENIETLAEFVREHRLRDAGYRHLSLVEGNDDRLIDVAVLSRLPLGPVTSWRHRTYRTGTKERPIFSRDLTGVEVLTPGRRRVLFTLYNTHLKSQLARNDAEREAATERRRRQAATIAAILRERGTAGRYVVVGDFNDTPNAAALAPLRRLGLVDALTEPMERGGPFRPPADDVPATTAWTHRFRQPGGSRYDLFDQIWLSSDLADRLRGSWILRRTRLEGDASDHDPAWVALDV